MEKHSINDLAEFLKLTNEAKWMKKIKSSQKFYSLSNFVYKITFEDDSCIMIKISNSESENILIFNKENIIELMKSMNYGKEIFLYFGDQFDIEAFVKSKNLGQQDFLNKDFRKIITKRIAEFNSIGFDNADKNIFTMLKTKNVLQKIILEIRSDMKIFCQKQNLVNSSDINDLITGIWKDFDSNKFNPNILDKNSLGKYLII